MSIISLFWNYLKKCVFVDKFDEKYENVKTATIFGLYCFSGGFYFHEDVRPGFRKFWIYYTVFDFILISVSCLFYLFNSPAEDYIGWLLPIQVITGTLGTVGEYYWLYSNRDLFSKLIDTIDENEKKYQKYVSFCTMRLKKTELKIIKILCYALTLCTVVYNLENYCKRKDYIILIYPMYFPFSIAFPLPIIIRFVQIVTVLPQVIMFSTFPTLIFLITLETYNRFEMLSVYLRETTYSVRLTIDEIWNLEIAMDEQRIPNTETKIRQLNMRRALTLDELVRKTIIVMERHQELYTIAKLLAEKLEYICYIISAGVFVVAVIDVAFITLIIDPANLQRSVLFITMTFGISVYWLIFCIVGELFQNMNEVIAMEIYESPWYYLKPKDRRLVHAFLNMIQRPISIVVWRIYPMRLGAFPDMLDTVYTNMQRLRTIQSYKREFCT